jgi:hypothetical protein
MVLPAASSTPRVVEAGAMLPTVHVVSAGGDEATTGVLCFAVAPRGALAAAMERCGAAILVLPESAGAVMTEACKQVARELGDDALPDVGAVVTTQTRTMNCRSHRFPLRRQLRGERKHADHDDDGSGGRVGGGRVDDSGEGGGGDDTGGHVSLSALDEARAMLALVAAAVVKDLGETVVPTLPIAGDPADGLVDAFLYRRPQAPSPPPATTTPIDDGEGATNTTTGESDRARKRHPCPAHVDPGLITLLVDDGTPGLDVCVPRESASEATKEPCEDSMWVGPLTLQAHHVVVMASRELSTLSHGRVPAALHRVATVGGDERVSLTYETRAGLRGREEINRILDNKLRRTELPPTSRCTIM